MNEIKKVLKQIQKHGVNAINQEVAAKRILIYEDILDEIIVDYQKALPKGDNEISVISGLFMRGTLLDNNTPKLLATAIHRLATGKRVDLTTRDNSQTITE